MTIDDLGGGEWLTLADFHSYAPTFIHSECILPPITSTIKPFVSCPDKLYSIHICPVEQKKDWEQVRDGEHVPAIF